MAAKERNRPTGKSAGRSTGKSTDPAEADQRPTTTWMEPSRPITTYWDRAQQPLQSLYFLIPTLLIYEIGSRLYRPSGDALPPILAESWISKFLENFGGPVLVLPLIALVGILLAQHLTDSRRGSWMLEWRLQPLMWIESVLLAVPLFVFAMVLFRQPVATEAAALWTLAEAPGGNFEAVSPGGFAGGSAFGDWTSGALLSLGAGIYEELLFRLVAITLLHLVLTDVLGLREDVGMWMSILIAALGFALYHFDASQRAEIRGLNAARVGQALYYVLAGVYFGLIFHLRGFGITAAAHAVYDVMYVTAYFMQRS